MYHWMNTVLTLLDTFDNLVGKLENNETMNKRNIRLLNLIIKLDCFRDWSNANIARLYVISCGPWLSQTTFSLKNLSLNISWIGFNTGNLSSHYSHYWSTILGVASTQGSRTWSECFAGNRKHATQMDRNASIYLARFVFREFLAKWRRISRG